MPVLWNYFGKLTICTPCVWHKFFVETSLKTQRKISTINFFLNKYIDKNTEIQTNKKHVKVHLVNNVYFVYLTFCQIIMSRPPLGFKSGSASKYNRIYCMCVTVTFFDSLFVLYIIFGYFRTLHAPLVCLQSTEGITRNVEITWYT